MTRTDAIEWCKSKLGQAMDFDGMYSAQCTDFANFYIQYLTGQNPYSLGFGVPGAKDYWNVRVPYFDYIQNDPNDANQLPKPGDIIIYDGGLSGSGGYGHVAIVGESKQVYYEQNWGGMYVKRNTRAFNGHEIGWLSFKGFSKGEVPMTVAEEQEAYRIVLGREMEHGGSGRTGLQFILAAKPEAQAIRDNANRAITDLRNQLAQVQEALKNEQSKPPKEVLKTVTEVVEKIVEVQKPYNEEEIIRGWFSKLWSRLLKTVFRKEA